LVAESLGSEGTVLLLVPHHVSVDDALYLARPKGADDWRRTLRAAMQGDRSIDAAATMSEMHSQRS
jgi:hypothetical protein